MRFCQAVKALECKPKGAISSGKRTYRVEGNTVFCMRLHQSVILSLMLVEGEHTRRNISLHSQQESCFDISGR